MLRSHLPAIHSTTDDGLLSETPEYCGALENRGSGREHDATARQILVTNRSLSPITRTAYLSS